MTRDPVACTVSWAVIGGLDMTATTTHTVRFHTRRGDTRSAALSPEAAWWLPASTGRTPAARRERWRDTRAPADPWYWSYILQRKLCRGPRQWRQTPRPREGLRLYPINGIDRLW